MPDLLPALSDRAALERYLADLPETERPVATLSALRQSRDRATGHILTMYRLARQLHLDGGWRALRSARGDVYTSAEGFLEEELGVSVRTALKRFAILDAQAALPPLQQGELEEAITVIGVEKATVLAPALQQAAERGVPLQASQWIARAHHVGIDALQKEVSEATDAKARGRGRVAAGDGGVRRYLLSIAPDDEAREVIEEFFRVGARVTEEPRAMGVLLWGLREATSSWLGHLVDQERSAPPTAAGDDAA